MIAYTNYLFDGRVRSEAEVLADSGFRVLCLTNKSGSKPTSFQLDGVTVRELNVSKYQGKNPIGYLASYLLFLLLSSAACCRLLLRRELDVVHAHNLPDFLVLAGLLPRLRGKKVVLDVHDSIAETFATKFAGMPLARKILLLEEKLSFLVAHRIICVNVPQQELLINRGTPSSKTSVCMNAPDRRLFKRSLHQTSPQHGFHLVYHGTMAERLGVDLIITAIAHLRERVPQLFLHLWGGGDDLEAFQDLARELGLDEQVLFKPAGVPLHELSDRLSQMNLGVVGNRRSVATELMLPVKLMEYVALEIPVVAPRLRTIERYFSDDMITFFEPGDVESMSNAIELLIRQPDLARTRAKQATTFLDTHGWNHQSEELVRFYKALVEN